MQQATNHYPLNFKSSWRDVTIEIGKLPQDTTTTVTKNTDTHYELDVRPTITPSLPSQDDHSLRITLSILKTGMEGGAQTCSVPTWKDDLGFPDMQNGPYKISITNYLPTHSSGPYSNPNPYTPEIKEIIRTVLESMKIGKC